MSEHRDVESEALDRVSRELRAEPSPELDWERIEQRLFERIDASRESAPARAGAWRVVAALAVAAVIALVAGAVLRRGAPTPARTAPVVAAARVIGPEASSPQDGATLAVGDTLLSGARDLVVEHAGRVSWTLEPGSRASVAELGEVITLRLESGALSAKVVPSPKPETFVIEVASARVAVHGTAFRVERRASEFAVSVSEGEVAVGPIGQRDGTSGWRLTHGDSGQFSFDGKTGTVQHADAVVIAPSQPAVEAPVEPGKPVASARPIKPLTPSSEEITRTVGAVESAALACFVEHTPAGEVRVQVQTRLTVGIGPDGKVHQVSFDPPLSPAITECVHAEAAKLRIRESEQGGTGSRLLLLGS